ncbi:MAG: hypothetical protein AAF617_09455 [Bacteroidota bacterium]
MNSQSEEPVKLTKQQLQYIDAYLERSGITYWDVRTELLDHIASAVEEKMTTEHSSFEAALEAVSISFGNHMRNGYVLNSDNSAWVSVGVFSDGEGFKKLQKEKRKQINKKYTKVFCKQLGHVLLSLRFYVEFVLLLLLVYSVSMYNEKLAIGAGMLYLFMPFVWMLYWYIKGEIPKKSLHLQVAALSLILWIDFYGFVPNMYEMFADKKFSFQLYVWSFVFLFPLIKTSFICYNNVRKEYKKYYDLISN